MPTERESELVATIGFLALLAGILLVIIGINLPAIQGDAPSAPTPAQTHSWGNKFANDVDDCNPPTLIICKEYRLP